MTDALSRQECLLPTPSLPPWKSVFGILALFFAATFLVYGSSLRAEFVRWDDGMLVYENAAIREITPRSLGHIFTTYDPELYIPLTFLTYQVNYLIGGQNPFIYHLTNLILHTFNAVFVAWLIYLLGKKGWMAIAVGLLFALHPLHTEAVEWVSARKDVLSTFFFLLSLIHYVRWRHSDRRSTYLWSLVTFALGLMSKVMIITLPVVLLLLDYGDGRRWSFQLIKEKIPYFVISILFGVIGIFGKTGVLQSSTLSAKILMACKSAVFYLEKIVFPFHFSLLYPYIKPITFTSPDFYVPILIILLLIATAAYSRKWTRNILFGLGFYIVTVAPTFLNFAKGGEMDVYFASDRYAYIPSIGIFFAAFWILWQLLETRRVRNQKTVQMIVGGVTAVVLIGCAGLSYAQSKIWLNTEALFQNVLAHYPDSSHVAHNNLGNVYRLRGELTKAETEYKQAIAIRPHAKTISNLGVVYRRQGNLALALTTYNQALSIDPDSKEAHLGLGLVYLTEKKFEEAAKEFQTAITIDPEYEEAYTNLGAALVSLGKLDEAITQYRKAIAINAFFPDAHYNLAVALVELGKKDEAIAEYEETVRLLPTVIPARINLALLYFERGRKDEAREQFEAILKIDPSNKAARSALSQMGAKN